MTAQLIGQRETDPDAIGRTYGAEAFADGEQFTARFHIRTYDGIRVESAWSSKLITLDATDAEAARREAGQRLSVFVRSLSGDA